MPRKRVLEEAVRCYWRESENQARIDVFEETYGAWKRTASCDDIVQHARKQYLIVEQAW